jgi:radical SAM-linked protein
MWVRMHWTKTGKIRWTSHRDAARMWERALRRAELAVAYSQGFSPRPRISFGLALPTGCESLAEYLDIDLVEPVGDLGSMAALVSSTLPVGMEVLDVAAVEPGTESLQAVVVACRWEIDVDGISHHEARLAVQRLLDAPSAVVVRRRKAGEGPDDIRPGIVDLSVRPRPTGGSEVSDEPGVTLDAVLGTKPRGVRPSDLVAAAFHPTAIPGGVQTNAGSSSVTERRALRLEQLVERDARLVPLTLTSLTVTSESAAGLTGASW